MFANRIVCFLTTLLSIIFFLIVPVSTFVLGILVNITFGLLLLPLSLIWTVFFFGPLIGTSVLWQKVPFLRPLLAIICIPLAAIGFIFCSLIPSMGDRDSRVSKLMLCETWPFTWKFYLHIIGKFPLMPRACAYSTLELHLYETGEYEKIHDQTSELCVVLKRLSKNNPSYMNYLRSVNEYRIELCKQVIDKNPNSYEAHLDIGMAYVELGLYPKAIEAYNQAILVKPYFAQAYCGIGVAYEKLDRYEDAIVAYKRAIEIYPNFVWARHNLGITCVMKGDIDTGLEQQKKLKVLAPYLLDSLADAISFYCDTNHSTMKQKRIHYLFVHEVLRDLFFASPQKIVDIFTHNGKNATLDLWNTVGKVIKDSIPSSSDGLNCESRTLVDNTVVILIILPQPQYICEAHLVALIYRPESVKHEGITRFIVLEHDDPPMLCEWNEIGTHYNLGYSCDSNLESFFEVVRDFVPAQERQIKLSETIDGHSIR